MSGSAGRDRDKARRAYRPRVEALEALRLLSGGAGLASSSGPSPTDSGVAALSREWDAAIPGMEGGPGVSDSGSDSGSGPGGSSVSVSGEAARLAWDEALGQSEVSAWLTGGSGSGAESVSVSVSVSGAAGVAGEPDSESGSAIEGMIRERGRGSGGSGAIEGAVARLNRYLGQAWGRAGLSPDLHEDYSQAVFERLLEDLGRDRFDALMRDIDRQGVRSTLNRDTAAGPDFFRAVDTVKKRAQREREKVGRALSLEEGLDSGRDEDWRLVLGDLIAGTLNEREASLIRATIAGSTPAEIAEDWKVTPKTVSNEKCKAIGKMREALIRELEGIF